MSRTTVQKMSAPNTGTVHLCVFSPHVCVALKCVRREWKEKKKRKRAELIRMAGDAKVVLREKVEDEEEDDHLEEEEDKGPDGAAEEELLREQERELDKEERREEELPREPDAFAEHRRDLREREREDRKRRKRVQCRCCTVCVFFPCRAQSKFVRVLMMRKEQGKKSVCGKPRGSQSSEKQSTTVWYAGVSVGSVLPAVVLSDATPARSSDQAACRSAMARACHTPVHVRVSGFQQASQKKVCVCRCVCLLRPFPSLCD